MNTIELIALGASYLVTAGGGYFLATHMHSIANAAAQKVVNQVASTVGATATLQPTTQQVSPPRQS